MVGLTVIMSGALTSSAAAIDLRPSDAEQIKLGQDAAAQVRKQDPIAPATDARVILMRRIGERLVAQIPEAERKKTGFKYTFDLIDRPEVNAFALPGGPIFFYAGLFERFQTQDQLAAVMAHEIIHVREEHWATAYADNLKRQLGLSLLLSAFDVNRELSTAITVVDGVVFTLPYSRRHETRADDGGYELMLKAGFHPQGMPQMFQKLGAERTDWLSSKLSTHPDTRARIQRAEARLKQDQRKMPAATPMPAAVIAANLSARRKMDAEAKRKAPAK